MKIFDKKFSIQLTLVMATVLGLMAFDKMRDNVHNNESSRFIKPYDVKVLWVDCFPDLVYSDTSTTTFDSIKIYNRWGNMMFSASDTTSKWFCKEAKTCQITEGTYFYMLYEHKISDGKSQMRSSTITVLR